MMTNQKSMTTMWLMFHRVAKNTRILKTTFKSFTLPQAKAKYFLGSFLFNIKDYFAKC